MALRLAKTIKGCITGNYWKIIQTKADCITGKTTAVLGLYLDEAHRATGAENYIHAEVVKMIGNDMILKDIYIKMKQSQKDGEGHETNEWEAAEDILEAAEPILTVEPK